MNYEASDFPQEDAYASLSRVNPLGLSLGLENTLVVEAKHYHKHEFWYWVIANMVNGGVL